MPPIRKPFEGEPLFPFELIHLTTKKQNDELPDHLHDRYELVYIHRGQGVFFIDQDWYEKKRGDLFLIPGNTIHRSLPRDEDPIVSSALFFAPSLLAAPSLGDGYDPLLAFEFARQRRTYRIELTESLISVVESALEQIGNELRERQPGFREAVRGITSRLLLAINRLIWAEKDFDLAAEASVGPVWMNDVLRRIDESPEAQNGLAALAQQANVSAPHFSRVFKRLTTMNLTQYVNAKRMIRAKELLRATELTVEEVSRSCGYETPAHFYRVFKTLTGLTPKSYRNAANLSV
ncbi:helix-turn-helix domain-containing protein [Paenibacillus shenyangensis]|uniref:helix-turn-helix domain-containing protein n=1 Tax=Paenibacillus sp. A9 TaxID=1284352 RepID=UPI00036DE51C|nr:AraC family transcriptional regulator [Paenibacillus sp. A9]